MRKKNNLYLTVVIPAYNEVENFDRGALDPVASYLKKQKYHWEVILVNDGSTDQTLSRLKKFASTHSGFRALDIKHGGKVAAVTAGIKESIGEIVIFTDFDQSVPIIELEKVLKQFESNSVDVVIGTRTNITGWSLIQRIRSATFNMLVRLIILSGILDSQCGFKAFKNEVAKKLFSHLKVTYHTQKGGYMGAFDVELLHLARKFGYKIAQVPVSWHYFTSGRLSWSEPFKMLKDVLIVRWEDLTGGYNIEGIKHRGALYHLLPIIILLVLTIPAFYDTLAVGYFPMHDDLQATRQLIMDKCFQDLQIPCRWSVDLGYGFGYPLFNYYPPAPYYIGQVIHWLGLSFLDTVKALVVLNFIVSGLLMYFLAKEFWGRWGGLLSALMFVYAPYHALDIYARGAMNEAWALAFMPGVFWGIYKLITTRQKRYIVATSLFTACLMLSHNPMLMIFAPSAVVWTIFWLLQTKNFKVLPKLVLAGAWALGLAAFFTLPVIVETKYAHVESLVSGYFNYLAHFATFRQLFFDTVWGYGDSRFGPVDGISFQVGLEHWILALFSFGVAIYSYKKNPKIAKMIIMMVSLATIYTFMNHQKSSPIWSLIKPLEYLQFPWRFLTMSIFTTSFLGGSVVLLLRVVHIRWLRNTFFILLILGVFGLYQPYFKWRDHWPWVYDDYKFSGELWRLQITSGIFDYLPIWAPLPPPYPPNGDSEVIDGKGVSTKLFKNSVRQEYKVEASENIIFQINTFYFPGWKYFVDGVEVMVDPKDDPVDGRPRIKLSPGEHIVVAKLENTPVRAVGDWLSLTSWIILLGLLIRTVSKNLARKTNE